MNAAYGVSGDAALHLVASTIRVTTCSSLRAHCSGVRFAESVQNRYTTIRTDEKAETGQPVTGQKDGFVTYPRM